MITEDIRFNGGVITLTFKDAVVGDERWYATDNFDYYQFSLKGTWMVKVAGAVIPIRLLIPGLPEPGPIKMSQVHVNLVPMFGKYEIGFQKHFIRPEPESIAHWIADNLGLSREEELELRLKFAHMWHERVNRPAVLSSGDDVPDAADDA